jgi:opacity protein-like surface antigen
MRRIGRWLLALAAALAMPAFAAEHDCYVGVLGGGVLGQSRHNNSSNGPITDDFDLKGGTVGANAGCLWKANRNGYGLEADLSGLKVKGSTSQLAPFDTSMSAETRVERLATLRAVLGYETRPGWFAYGTAGLATARGRINVCTFDGSACASDEKRLWGLAGGVGAEYAMSRALRLRFEYLFVGFAKKKFMDPAPAGFADRGGGVEAELHLFRAGLTLHF